MKIKNFLILFSLFAFLSSPGYAYWVWSPEEGRFVNPEGVAADSADEQYLYAMQFYKEKNFDEAIKQLEKLLEKYPSSFKAAEAQYRLGTIYEEKNDYLKAFEAYKVILDSYPQSERLNEVIEREYRIGNLFLSGKKGKLWGIEILPSLPKAVEVFDHIVISAPYSDYGDKALFRKGLAYRKMGRFADAMDAFQQLTESYPQSELVPEARYQLAETSYQRSTYQFRDQRALEDATKQIDSYLTRYPDAEASEKAAKFRQQIDEKNAEKNYRIGVYYEKTNYLKSALIYLSDVARRYPHTKWGKKAAERLQAIEQPTEFVSEKMATIKSDIAGLEAQLAAVDKKDKAQRQDIESQLDRLKQKEKAIDLQKAEGVQSRVEDLKRRERELKEKVKKLAKKRKLLEKNPSEDLNRALERWELSLRAEKENIMEEKRQLADWKHELGMKDRKFSLDFIPFVGESPSEIERVRSMDAKKYYKVSREKKNLLSRKEVLYKQYGEVVTRLKGVEGDRSGLALSEEDYNNILRKGDAQLSERNAQIDAIEKEVQELERELDSSREMFKEKYGAGWKSWVTKPAAAVAKSFSAMNPFDREELDEMPLEALLERQMHLKEKAAAQQSLINTLSQAFDSELALQERKRLLDQLQSNEKVDPRELRKTIRNLEREIRSRYEEIDDRHKAKKKLLKELDAVVKQSQKSKGTGNAVVRGVTYPFKTAARLSHAFIFGEKAKDVRLTEEAEVVSRGTAESGRVLEIKEQIKQESLLIEARSQELEVLRRELEIHKAKASLSGGYKFRSAMVDLPYSFIKDAVDSANRLVPQQDKQEMLVDLLDKETTELKSIEAEQVAVRDAIKVKTGRAQKAAVEKVAQEEAAQAEGSQASESEARDREAQRLKTKIESTQSMLEEKKRALKTQQHFLKKEKKILSKEIDASEMKEEIKKEGQGIIKQEKKLRGELGDLEKELGHVIMEERKLEEVEFKILKERIGKIDGLVESTISKVAAEELMVERDRIEDRLNQIQLRQDFLSKELERFKMTETSVRT